MYIYIYLSLRACQRITKSVAPDDIRHIVYPSFPCKVVAGNVVRRQR